MRQNPGQRLELYAATPAAGAQSLTGTAQTGYYTAHYAEWVLDVSAAATEVGDTLDVYVDTVVGGGATAVWVNAIHFAQVLGNGGAKRFAATLTPSASVATAPIDVSSDAAAGAIRHIIGDQWRYRIVQVDANSNAAFAITLRGYLY